MIVITLQQIPEELVMTSHLLQSVREICLLYFIRNKRCGWNARQHWFDSLHLEAWGCLYLSPFHVKCGCPHPVSYFLQCVFVHFLFSLCLGKGI